MNNMEDIKPNLLSENERIQLKNEMMMILEKCSKEEIEVALLQLKNKEQTCGIA